MTEVSERQQVRVRDGDTEFVFLAEPDVGRLVIREQCGDDEHEELCALTIADRDELAGFLTGLRRVFGVDAPATPGGDVPTGTGAGDPAARRTEALAGGVAPSPEPTSETADGADE